MTVYELKKNLRRMMRLYQISEQSAAEVMGVSTKTVRRYLDDGHPQVPDIVDFANLCEYAKTDLRAVLYPIDYPIPEKVDNFKKLDGMFTETIPVLVLTEDRQVVYSSRAFARLYETTPDKMVNTNMADWGFYSEQNYKWLPDTPATKDRRKEHIGQLMALAKEDGMASGKFFFLAPSGCVRRYVIQCILMDDLYLFVDTPLDDSSEFDAGLLMSACQEDSDTVCLSTLAAPKKWPLWKNTVLTAFMTTTTAEEAAYQMKMPLDEFCEVVYEAMDNMMCSTTDELREALWNWVSEDRFVDMAYVIRANHDAHIESLGVRSQCEELLESA